MVVLCGLNRQAALYFIGGKIEELKKDNLINKHGYGRQGLVGGI